MSSIYFLLLRGSLCLAGFFAHRLALLGTAERLQELREDVCELQRRLTILEVEKEDSYW